MNFKIRVVICLGLLLIAPILIPTIFTESLRAQARPSATFTVQVGPSDSISFSPATQEINVGDTTHWVWSSALIPHSTTSGTCSGLTCTSDGKWDSLMHTVPYSFDVTFNSTGVYPYFCSVHGSSMQGTIIVGLNNKTYLPLIIR